MTAEWRAAIAGGSVATLERLLAAGADIDARDAHGQTGLMIAAHHGEARVVEWLAARGADLDRTAKFGLSALMLAAIGGRADAVRVLVNAGARQDFRGSGAFAGQTARDIAAARADRAVLAALGPETPAEPRVPEPAFVVVDSWDAAAALVTFVPRVPRDVGQRRLRGLRVFVRDHRGRAGPAADRSLEAQFDGVVLSQSRHAPAEARRRVAETPYGQHGRPIVVAGREGRAYPRGPDVPPDDPDGRSPCVVVWADGEMMFLLASQEAPVEELCRVGASMYDAPARRAE
jgi:uncharacterized protein